MKFGHLCGAFCVAVAGRAVAQPSAALAQAEAELARATLVAKPGLASARAQFEALRKHFALTPSLHAWGDHAGLLNQLKGRGAPEGGDPEAPAWQKLVAAEFVQSQKMRTALSRDFAKAPAEVLAHPPSTAINVQIAARSSRDFKLDPARMTAMGLGRWGGRAPGPSFFKPDALVAGFAGGPLVGRQKARDAEGVVYSVSYDARSAAALADLYEIAKSRGLAVKASWREAELADLSSSLTNGRGRIDQLQLTLRLPVWVATEKGLLPGVLRSATYGSDGCGTSDKPEDFKSLAEVVLAQPARSPILAVFATTAPVDATRARVLPQRETRLRSATLTYSVDAAIDLDGDGVTDLRTVISEDREVSQSPWLDPARALAQGWRPEHMHRAAGWYAYNLYQLEANEQGWWRVLSRYNLVTCT